MEYLYKRRYLRKQATLELQKVWINDAYSTGIRTGGRKCLRFNVLNEKYSKPYSRSF